MNATIQKMSIDDYDQVLSLWRAFPGVGLSSADSREGIGTFLIRNPGLSLVAKIEGRIVGAALCGHDRRRGYLYHLAVTSSCRRQGVGRALAGQRLARLQAEGIMKCHVFIFRQNREAEAFWRDVGWTMRTELQIMSADIAADVRAADE
ncbi:MAG: GNAT family N-acetyltransferase [Phycisphaerales bacterium]|nr:MAG: GNAT family N-acetyltransferase [Phycisphaerales bacterium]